MRGQEWSIEEVEATVAAYFAMLKKDLQAEEYSKAKFNRSLANMLDGRSNQAVEYKHANISAILEELRHPWIRGYKPRGNYQQLLAEAVVRRVNSDEALRATALERSEQPAVIPSRLPSIEPPPTPGEMPPLQVREARPLEAWLRQAHRIDYFAREARNRSLGEAGEEVVVRLERARLRAMGLHRLAQQVERISATRGDGAGFDVLSFGEGARERFIEVKTTSFAKETPFHVTKSEVNFSVDFAEQYYLYRIFSFRSDPRMYALQGALERTTRLEPNTFIASPI